MYELTISKGRLMAMWVAIAVLLILVIVLSLKLRAEPKIPPDFAEFQRILAQETSVGATIIDITGKLTPFDRNGRLVDKSGESSDNRIPENCRPTEGSVLLFKNDVNVLVSGKEILLRTGDGSCFVLPRPRCPDGSPRKDDGTC